MRIFFIFFFLIIVFSCNNNNNFSENETQTFPKGNIFRYNQTGGLTSLDPAFARVRANIWACTQLYNGLVRFSGKDLSMKYELAEKYELSKDGKVYTFTLKKGVFFHDNPCFPNGKGREMKASDFVYSFNRILKDGTGAWVFRDKVLKAKPLENSEKESKSNETKSQELKNQENKNQELKNDPKSQEIKKPEIIISDTAFKAVDDYTLRIYLEKPFPAFLQMLATPYTAVIPYEAIEKYKKDFRKNPVGTGAFLMRNGLWDERNKLILHKNPNYWKKDAKNQKLPYLDAVEVSFIEDRTVEFNTFFDGKLDLIANLSEVSRDQILEKSTGKVKERFAGKFKVVKNPYMMTEFIGFYQDTTILKDLKNPLLHPKVRQALNYAINRKGLLQALRNNLGIVGDFGVLPKAFPNFDSTKVNGYAYNPPKAQELLKEAGFPNGENLPIITLNTYQSDREVAEYLQKDWEQIGVKVNIELNHPASHSEKVEQGKLQMFRFSWIADYPDAENFLGMFYSPNFTPIGSNKTHFKNEVFDKLFQETSQMPLGKGRNPNYQKLNQIIMENSPVAVLYYDEVLRLCQNRVLYLEADALNSLLLETVKVK